MAMKWVVDNIAQFGGNRNLITLGGLVGGGAYVPIHMVSPASKGMTAQEMLCNSETVDPHATLLCRSTSQREILKFSNSVKCSA